MPCDCIHFFAFFRLCVLIFLRFEVIKTMFFCILRVFFLPIFQKFCPQKKYGDVGIVYVPRASLVSDRRVIHLGLPAGLTSLGFDGMFGVHRALQKGVDVRKSMAIGRPKNTYYRDAHGILRTA